MRINAALAAQRRWVCWRKMTRPNGGTGKRPVNKDGYPISWSQPHFWMTAFEARALHLRYPTKIDGIGFVFGPDAEGSHSPFAAIDLDGALDPNTGEIATWASVIVDRFCSYTEISPSGCGLRIIVRATGLTSRKLTVNAAPFPGGKEPGLEVFASSGFVTITGRRFNDQPIRDGTEKLATLCPLAPDANQVCAARISSVGTDLTDTDLKALSVALRAGDLGKFKRLWAGDWTGYPSHSEADFALLEKLRFYVRNDRAAMDRLFRCSGLMRPKWDERHYANGDTYGQRFIDNCVDNAVQQGWPVYDQ